MVVFRLWCLTGCWIGGFSSLGLYCLSYHVGLLEAKEGEFQEWNEGIVEEIEGCMLANKNFLSCSQIEEHLGKEANRI